MQLTKSIVQKLIDTINAGLCHGAGDMIEPGSFCVQQAVSHAIGMDQWHDHPRGCIGDTVRSFGVHMNDQKWSNPKARADGMRRFAIAQLGSNKVPHLEFNDLVVRMWNNPDTNPFGASTTQEAIELCRGDKDLEKLCEIAVKALIILETEGSKYLYMTELPKKEQQKIADRYLFVPQLQWRGYNVANPGQRHIAH